MYVGMEVMSKSRYLCLSGVVDVIKDNLMNPSEMSEQEKTDKAYRLRMLVNAGFLRVSTDNEGNEIYSKTDTTKYLY